MNMDTKEQQDWLDYFQESKALAGAEAWMRLRKIVETSLCAQIERGRGKVSVYDFTEFRDGDPVSVYGADGERTLAIWRSFCPTCGSTSCPNLKNAAAMCPGPAP